MVTEEGITDARFRLTGLAMGRRKLALPQVYPNGVDVVDNTGPVVKVGMVDRFGHDLPAEAATNAMFSTVLSIRSVRITMALRIYDRLAAYPTAVKVGVAAVLLILGGARAAESADPPRQIYYKFEPGQQLGYGVVLEMRAPKQVEYLCGVALFTVGQVRPRALEPTRAEVTMKVQGALNFTPDPSMMSVSQLVHAPASEFLSEKWVIDTYDGSHQRDREQINPLPFALGSVPLWLFPPLPDAAGERITAHHKIPSLVKPRGSRGDYLESDTPGILDWSLQQLSGGSSLTIFNHARSFKSQDANRQQGTGYELAGKGVIEFDGKQCNVLRHKFKGTFRTGTQIAAIQLNISRLHPQQLRQILGPNTTTPVAAPAAKRISDIDRASILTDLRSNHPVRIQQALDRLREEPPGPPDDVIAQELVRMLARAEKGTVIPQLLEEWASPKNFPDLFRVLETRPEFRFASRQLIEAHGTASEAQLITWINAKDIDLVLYACDLLRVCGTQRSIPALRSIAATAKKSGTHQVFHAAERAIKALETRVQK